jgi:hypothetical protein
MKKVKSKTKSKSKEFKIPKSITLLFDKNKKDVKLIKVKL